MYIEKQLLKISSKGKDLQLLDIENLNSLLGKDINVNITDSIGNSPLINLCNSNYYNKNTVIAVNLLLNSSNINVNLVNNYGDTALTRFSDPCLEPTEDYFLIYKALLNSEVDINYQDNKGFTALHYAYVYQAYTREDRLVNLLKKNTNLDENLCNKYDLTAEDLLLIDTKYLSDMIYEDFCTHQDRYKDLPFLKKYLNDNRIKGIKEIIRTKKPVKVKEYNYENNHKISNTTDEVNYSGFGVDYSTISDSGVDYGNI